MQRSSLKFGAIPKASVLVLPVRYGIECYNGIFTSSNGMDSIDAEMPSRRYIARLLSICKSTMGLINCGY